jgi:hypothetical protein
MVAIFANYDNLKSKRKANERPMAYINKLLQRKPKGGKLKKLY